MGDKVKENVPVSGAGASTGRRKRTDDPFYQGFACAAASLARDHGQPSMAVDIMDCNGITLEDLEMGGADTFDLEPLRKEWKEQNR